MNRAAALVVRILDLRLDYFRLSYELDNKWVDNFDSTMLCDSFANNKFRRTYINPNRL